MTRHCKFESRPFYESTTSIGISSCRFTFDKFKCKLLIAQMLITRYNSKQNEKSFMISKYDISLFKQYFIV